MSAVLGVALQLGAVLLLAVLISLLVAPLDSLSWWAGWVRQGEPAGGDPTGGAPVVAGAPAPAGPFAVFLSGVGTMGGQIDAWEQRLTDRLEAGMHGAPDGPGGPGGPGVAPGGVLVTGIFPFSASAEPLVDRRRSGGFWRWVGRMEVRRPGLWGMLVSWRNLTQVFVSIDPRYGPVFDAGSARSLHAALVNHGYVPGSGAPVVLIGYSGGAQVCLGAATYLKPVLGAPLTIISLGGAVGSVRGLEAIDRMYQLYGSGDVEQRLPGIFFPSRWPLARSSHWNRALVAGRVRPVFLGDMVHTGPQGYLDPRATVPDGRTHLDVTAGAMLGIIRGSVAGAARAPATARPGPPSPGS